MSELPKEAPPPAWVSSKADMVEGLDLLGLRVPVEAIGRTLLTGVTTISPTVRYIVLRAWIARRYALARLPDSWSSFRAFAGKIEAAVAVGNLLVNRRAGGLVGRSGAAKLVDSNADPLQMDVLVSQLAASAYAGPSNELFVSWSADSQVPGLTQERGLPLADLVEETLGKTAIGRCLEADPLASVFSRNDLLELGAAFPIAAPNEAERRILIDCILPWKPQSTERGRIATYGALLELSNLLGKRVRERDLFEEALSTTPRLPACYQACLDGWTRYQVRDMLAVVHEAILALVVEALRARSAPGFVRAHDLLESLLARGPALQRPLEIFGLLPGGASPLDQPLATLAEAIHAATRAQVPGQHPRWGGPLQELAVIDLALENDEGCLSLAPVAWLLARARVGGSSRTASPDARLLSYQGWWRFGIDQVVLPGVEDMLRRGVTIREAAYELAWRSIEQHLNVAWARLAADPQKDVSVLSSDGDHWSYRARERKLTAGRIASRLREAIGWLGQLGLIDDGGCTNEGRHYLGRIQGLLSSSGEGS